MNELILLPWTTFKYIFSLLFWGLLFFSIHHQWVKHDCTEWSLGKLKQFNKTKKEDKPEDYIV